MLAPRLPRLKEWAYAGMVFDLTAASVAHAAVGDPLGNVVAPILLTGIVLASWALRPGERKLAGAPLRPARPAATGRAKGGPLLRPQGAD